MKALLIIIIILTSVYSTTYLQPQKIPEFINVRSGQVIELNYPKLDLKQIYHRQVYSLGKNSELLKCDICQVQKASLQFKSFNTLKFDFQKQVKNVIYDFQDIKYRQGIIDIAFQNNTINIVFQNGNLSVLQFNQKHQLKLKKVLIFPNVTNLESGRLISISNRLVFINSQMAFVITDTIQRIQNFGPLNRFVDSIVVAEDKYIIISQKNDGVIILKYENNSVKLETTLQNLFFQRLQIDIIDLQYDPNSKILYVLDANYGAYTVSFFFLEDYIITRLLSKNYHHFNCDNIQVFNGQVILSCQQIYKYTGNQRKIYPNPLFKVKQLYSFQKFLIVIGQNKFQLYYNDQHIQSNYFMELDRFYIMDGKYLGIFEDKIQYGFYLYKPPTIKCQKTNFVKETIVSLVLKTQADCNLQYIKKEKISIIPKEDDRCIYTTTLYVDFWKAGDFNIGLIIIGISIFILFIIVLCIWMSKTKTRKNLLQESLQIYLNQKTPKGYNVMIEQSQQNKSENPDRQLKEISGKKDIPQPESINHEIGE